MAEQCCYTSHLGYCDTIHLMVNTTLLPKPGCFSVINILAYHNLRNLHYNQHGRILLSSHWVCDFFLLALIHRTNCTVWGAGCIHTHSKESTNTFKTQPLQYTYAQTHTGVCIGWEQIYQTDKCTTIRLLPPKRQEHGHTVNAVSIILLTPYSKSEIFSRKRTAHNRALRHHTPDWWLRACVRASEWARQNTSPSFRTTPPISQ